MLILLWEIPKLTQQSNMHRRLFLFCGALAGSIAVQAQDVIELQSGGADDDFRANHRYIFSNGEYGSAVFIPNWPNAIGGNL